MDDLVAKVRADGEAAEKDFKAYFEWCDDTTKTLRFDAREATAKKGKLTAQIAKLEDDIEVSAPKIEEVAGTIAESEKRLAEASKQRKAAAADFEASEAELNDVMDSLSRAIEILSRELQKTGSASFVQRKPNDTFSKVLESLSVVIEAASFASEGKEKLMDLLQAQDDEDYAGAPSGDAYKSKSGDIIEVLEDMRDKAESQLSDARKAEAESKATFEMLQQSLNSEIAADKKDLEEEKGAKAECEEDKAAAQGDLEITVKSLKANREALETTQNDCIQAAADHEAAKKSRGEELKALGKAKGILAELMGAKEEPSFLQVASGASQRAAGRGRAARVPVLLKDLAKRYKSGGLLQLASRITAVLKYSDDPFAKVRDLIQAMIGKLEKEMKEEASEKAFCDEETQKTEAKQGDLSDDKEKLTAKIDQAVAKTGQLKQEIKVLEGELGQLTKTSAEVNGVRQDQHADYVKTKADLEEGLSTVQKALKVLREYYESKDDEEFLQTGDGENSLLQQPSPPKKHEAQSGGANGIIGMLEVIASDLAKNLADVEQEESDLQAEFEQIMHESDLTKAEKKQAIKYKAQEAKSLDKGIGEVSADLETADAELAAVDEYFARIKGRCTAKPDSYEERQKRRDAEVQGLRQALDVLESEAASLLQRGGARGGRRLRGPPRREQQQQQLALDEPSLD